MAVTDEQVIAYKCAYTAFADKVIQERLPFPDFSFEATRAAIAAALSLPVSNTGEWRDIASAPTDGSWVFLYWPTMSIHMYPAVGFSHGDEYGWELAQDRDYGEVIPTHWHSMMEAPK